MKFGRIETLILVLMLFLNSTAQAKYNSGLTLLEKEGFKFSTYGLLETDLIFDTTRSFREIVGGSPVERSDTAPGVVPANGGNGRTQVTTRSTRIGFILMTPNIGNWKVKSVYEFDFFGYNPAPGATNSEAALYTSPTFRERLATIQFSNLNWDIVVGQDWQLFAWQPVYFAPTANNLTAIPGVIEGVRAGQLKLVNKAKMGGNDFQTAISAQRPFESDSNVPDFAAGMRLMFNSWKGAMMGGGYSRDPKPASIGLSTLYRTVVVPSAAPKSGPFDTQLLSASAFAVDLFIPVIASSNGRSTSNNLSLQAEYTTGSGYGDQSTTTGNMASPLSAASSGVAKTVSATRPIILDGGIGDYDTGGNFHLLQMQTLNGSLQYHFPKELPYWLGIGYGSLTNFNMGDITTNAFVTSAGKIGFDNLSIYYADAFWEINACVRLAIEFNHITTHYLDGITAANDRYQMSAYMSF